MLHKYTKNHDQMIIYYTVPELQGMTDVICIFHRCTKNCDRNGVIKYGMQWMNIQKGGQKK